MCRICKSIDTTDTETAMAQIEAAIANGQDPEHFKKALDKLLGTEEPEQNEVLDAAWENSRPRSR